MNVEFISTLKMICFFRFPSRFATPFASRDYRQQHMPTHRTGVVSAPPSVANLPAQAQPSAVMYNPIAPPPQANAAAQQPTLFYGGYSNFYSGAYQPTGGQGEWWNPK